MEKLRWLRFCISAVYAHFRRGLADAARTPAEHHAAVLRRGSGEERNTLAIRIRHAHVPGAWVAGAQSLRLQMRLSSAVSSRTNAVLLHAVVARAYSGTLVVEHAQTG